MDPSPVIRTLSAPEAFTQIPALSSILMDCVEGGASVSFMAPLTRDRADAFWRKVANGVAARHRILLLAELDGNPVGTVQLVLDLPENQPHRADLSKLLVKRSARNRGVAASLMQAVDQAALEAGRTLLVLDTASGEAERVYTRQNWVRVGDIPGYALYPDGRPCATAYFYKELSNLAF